MNTSMHPCLDQTIKNILDDDHSTITLVDVMSNDAALKVVNAARISYGNNRKEYSKKDQRLAKFLWDHEHTSPYRHTYFSFAISAPLFVFRQWVKYQVGSTWRSYEIEGNEVFIEAFDHMFDEDKGCSWNEFSGRYAEFEPHFYVPQRMRANAKHGNKQASSEPEEWSDEFHCDMHMQMHQDYEHALERYKYYIDQGIAKEIARTVLPQNIYTKAYWTVSLQSVLWFLHQRLKPDAQFEIRQYAGAIHELLRGDLERLGIETQQEIYTGSA